MRQNCLKIFYRLTAILIIMTGQLFSQNNFTLLRGFTHSPYFSEQIKTFNIISDVRVHINAPSAQNFDPLKPTQVIVYALPSGNTIEQTVGKVLQPGDDWHFDIQHIGAQTRFLRNSLSGYNIVTVYFEAAQKSWTLWKSAHPSDYAALTKSFIDSVANIFAAYSPEVVLNGHSNGGRFIFNYFDAVASIPSKIKRIAFLDSNYGYEHSYGDKMIAWMNASSQNVLCVIAYNDSVALLNGEPIVSPTGGTWYRSRIMKHYMESAFTFTDSENDSMITYTALNGRIKFLLKTNPLRQILHTVQVERNGYIQSICQATQQEGQGYVYYGPRAYQNLIQTSIIMPAELNIPPRQPGAKTGSQFMDFVTNMTFAQREEQIYNEIAAGNIPDFLRSLINVQAQFTDANGTPHTVIYKVMPDYLAIGSNEDFCRIPMGPITAQRLATLFGATMPTSKLVDNIYTNSAIKLQPVTYAPVGNQNELVPKFVLHNRAIDSLRLIAGGVLGQLTGGTKKDVVVSNKIVDPSRPNHVTIYGWHQLNGQPIQPLTNIHINTYVDYSHGIRFLNNEIIFDGQIRKITDLLRDDILYKVLSDEQGAMSQPGYLPTFGVPGKPGSFGVIPGGNNSLILKIRNDPDAEYYLVQTSTNGIIYSSPFQISPSDPVITGLNPGTVYFLKIKAGNQTGESPWSEVLAGVTTSVTNPPLLIVNGFDRASAGNTYDFVRQHSAAAFNSGVVFCTATNEAVTDSLFRLLDFQAVDYILGEESTVDETFSTAEQTVVSNYLKAGGKLFVSGSEIAWDLDSKGSTADKNFIWNFLKTKYAADAPNNASNTWYSVSPVAGSFLAPMNPFSFDNGTHGTYNVDWPDVLFESGGSTGVSGYTNFNTASGFSGTAFSGTFTGGTAPGKVAVFGFPFESVYPEAARNLFMRLILQYFDIPVSVAGDEDSNTPSEFSLSENFPNPFNPSTTLEYSIPFASNISLTVYNVIGEKVRVLADEFMQPGKYRVAFDAAGLPSGVYLCRMEGAGFTAVVKMVLAK